MRLWVRCAVFFAVTYPVLYSAHFHLALWQYFALALVASLLRLNGYARPGSLVRAHDALELIVQQDQDGRGVTVRYAGVVPDQMRDGMEVVAGGRFVSAGHFEADELLVKCPSNYDRNAGVRPF